MVEYNKFNIPLEVALKHEINIDKFTDIGKLGEIDQKIIFEQFINEKSEFLKEQFKNSDENKRQELIDKILENSDYETIKLFKGIVISNDLNRNNY